MYFSKWASFSAGVFLQFCSGLCYTFSLFAPAIKQKFGLNQTELEGIGTALTAGGLFAFIPGILYDKLAHRHKLGPRCAFPCCKCHVLGFVNRALYA